MIEIHGEAVEVVSIDFIFITAYITTRAKIDSA